MPKSRGMAFATVFEELRIAAGLSPADVARKLDAPDSLVSRWRLGKNVPSLPYLEQLAELFKVDQATLEQLAGYRASGVAGTLDPALELERQRWRAWFDELREKKVPERMWTAYTAACEALAESFSNAASAADSALSHGQGKRVSKPRPSRAAANAGDDEMPNTVLSTLALVLANA